jgi:hypothetical protein
MHQDDCFLELKPKAKGLSAHLKELANSNDLWQKHFGFDCIEIEKEWIDKEPALAMVHSCHKIQRLGLLKIDAKTMYDWHVDAHRKSCLNMLISENHNSITLFGSQKDYINKYIIQLKYKPNTYYLFNNQQQHCVVNLDGPRYLFSLYFEKEIEYSQMKQILQQNHVA